MIVGLVNQNIHNDLYMVINFACIVIVEKFNLSCAYTSASSSLCVKNRSTQALYLVDRVLNVDTHSLLCKLSSLGVLFCP